MGDIRLDDEDLQLFFIDHWGQKAKQLREKLNGRDPATTRRLQQRNIRYADIYANVDRLMEFVSNMNILPLESLRQQNFLPLLHRIQAPRQLETSPRWHRKPDAEFQFTIREKIREILDQRGKLRAALESKAKDVLGEGDPLGTLCQADPATAIDDVLRPSTRQCLSVLPVNSAEHKDTWEAAKAILAWLSLYSVSPEWIQEQENNHQLSGLGFDIVVQTPCGVEIASSRYRQIPPGFHAEQDKPELHGKGAILYPLDRGWEDSNALEGMLLEIWDKVFPQETRLVLSDADIIELDRTLKNREKHKVNHYYIPVSESKKNCPLNRTDFCAKLVAKLPSITIIHFKSSGGRAALQVGNEGDFMTIIREFLTNPH